MTNEIVWRRLMLNWKVSINSVEVMLGTAREAGLLPEHIDVGHAYLRESKRLFEKGNEVAAGWAARAAWERANFLRAGADEKRQIRAGRKSVAKGDEANADKSRVANAKHEHWQQLANAHWKKKPNLSKQDVAKLIAPKVGSSVSTIRQAIKK